MPIDHREEAVCLLTTKYQLPNIRGLLESLVGVSQELDDLLERLPEETIGIDSAEGVQLALLAQLVGAPVVSGNDAATRARIRTQIRVNRSKGTLNDTLDVLDLFPVAESTVVEMQPAYLYVTAFSVDTAEQETLAIVLSQTRSAGVGQGLVVSTVPKSQTFRYSSQMTVIETGPEGYGSGVYAAFYAV